MATTRGPIPNRSEERRRRNKPEEGGEVTRVAGAEHVPVPEPDDDWHPIAYDWFTSLAESAQAQFYEPSDWEVAYLLADQISMQVSPRFVGWEQADGEDYDADGRKKPPAGSYANPGKARVERLPMKGSELSAILKGMSNLAVTEGDRRRLRIEVTRGAEGDGQDVGEAEAQRAFQLLQGGATG